MPARSSAESFPRKAPRPLVSICSNVSPSDPGAPLLRFASRYAASSVSSFTTWTCKPQKRWAGTDFARWPIAARSSLQIDRGLYHPAHASLRAPRASGRAPAQRALPRVVATTSPSARLSSSLCFPSRLAQLPCFRGFSPRDEEPFPVSTRVLVHVPPSSTPPNGASRVSDSGAPVAFAVVEAARRSGLQLTGPRLDVHASLRPAHSLTPPSGALSVGFAVGISHAGATRAMRLRSLAASGLSPYGSTGTSRHHSTTSAGQI